MSEFIAETIGLHFPPERFDDLRRGLEGAAGEFRFANAAAFAAWLLSAPVTRAQLQALASHLTVGETYFFRERQTLDVLANHVLPGLIRTRRGREQRLRLWSAACCSGEEPYSLAIMLQQILPDLADWHVTILATDINPHFLRKAAAGTYGEWSFRDVPAGFKERHFSRTPQGHYVVRPELRKLVKFELLNLAEDVYPSLATDTNAMDVILCRNVLMYFTREQTSKVVGNLHRALMEGGWLAVSPSEASQTLFPQFITRNFPGVILYQKPEAGTSHTRTPTPVLPAEPPAPVTLPTVRAAASPSSGPVPVPTPATDWSAAVSLYENGRYAEATDVLLACCAERPPEPRAFSLLTRALANLGRLAEALAWCDRWVAADKLDPAGHYVRAMVLLERGSPDEAKRSLQRALYLNPDFVLAHFALGILARSRGSDGEAQKHFSNALPALARLQADSALPESDGLTAGRLNETIAAMMTSGGAG